MQKLESKERRIHELEGKSPERCVSNGNYNDSNCSDNQLTADKLYSLVGRLNEQVRHRIINIRFFTSIISGTYVYNNYNILNT